MAEIADHAKTAVKPIVESEAVPMAVDLTETHAKPVDVTMDVTVANVKAEKVVDDGYTAPVKSQYVVTRDKRSASPQVREERPSKKAKKYGRKRPRLGDNMCSNILRGETCSYGKSCKFSHDLAEYAERKGEDIPGVCPFWSKCGNFCKYGLGCRLSKTHIAATPATENEQEPGTVVTKPPVDAIAVATRSIRHEEKGWLSREALQLLRKGKYAYPKSDRAQARIEEEKIEREKQAAIVAAALKTPTTTTTTTTTPSKPATTTESTTTVAAATTTTTPTPTTAAISTPTPTPTSTPTPTIVTAATTSSSTTPTPTVAVTPTPTLTITSSSSSTTTTTTTPLSTVDGSSSDCDHTTQPSSTQTTSLANAPPTVSQSTISSSPTTATSILSTTITSSSSITPSSSSSATVVSDMPKDSTPVVSEKTEKMEKTEKIEKMEKGDGGPMVLEPDNTVPIHRKKIDFTNKLLLAPLTTVGNLPFRRVCKGFGVDITYSEMTLATNLLKGLPREWSLVRRHESEDIFGAQIAAGNANIASKTAEVLEREADVDFIDLNCGCPIDGVFDKGMGSALMRERGTKFRRIVQAMSYTMDTPLSIKLRTGILERLPIASNFVPKLKLWGADLITLHGRSREARYTHFANWDYISECAKLAHPTPFVGNGDVLSFEDVNSHKEQLGVSSIMVGRGALIKPWIFKEIKEQRHWDISSGERFDVLRDYTKFGLEHWGSDTEGVEKTRRFLLEWCSFLHRYIPIGLMERFPQKINERPPKYFGRNDLETLMASDDSKDWIKLTEMLLGKPAAAFEFAPKHKSNSYNNAEVHG